MGISISYLSDLISYDKVVSLIVASIVLLLVWFKLNGSNYNNENNEHDKELFKQPPPREDCPICFLRLPYLETGFRYQSCCGKVICSGCYYAPVFDNQGNKVDDEKQNECPFCRVVAPKTIEEAMEREMKRVEAGDSIAIHNQGLYYREGINGYPQNYTKALKHWHRAAELGHTGAYCDIGVAYHNGQGVEVEKKKAMYYTELAAIAGNVNARHNLGKNEVDLGNMERALKHHMIAVRDGYNESLKQIQTLYKIKLATKEDYTKALQLYQAYLSEIKSSQRDQAAAFSDNYRYY